MMRMLALSAYYPPDAVGGYEQAARAVLEGLARRGHEVTVLTGCPEAGAGAAPCPAKGSGPKVERCLTRLSPNDFGEPSPLRALRASRAFLVNQRLVRQAIERVRPDILYWWCGALLTQGPLAACEESGLPTVFHLEDMWLLGAYAVGKAGGGSVVLRCLRRALGGREATFPVSCWGLIHVSESLQREYREGGFPEADACVIHNGCEANVPARAWPATAPEVPRLCFVGRLRPNKGPETLLAALARRHAEGGAFTCDMIGAGDGAYERHLRDLSTRLGLAAVVHWSGACRHEEMILRYGDYDCVMVPSLWEEPFGLVAIEALAAGVPVLASDRGALPEIVTPEVGWVVPPEPEALASALAGMVADWDSWRARGLAAAVHARTHFAWDDKIDGVERFLLRRLTRS